MRTVSSYKKKRFAQTEIKLNIQNARRDDTDEDLSADNGYRSFIESREDIGGDEGEERGSSEKERESGVNTVQGRNEFGQAQDSKKNHLRFESLLSLIILCLSLVQ